MTPIQQMLLGVGASEKTYMDDVFSTYLYTCNNGNTININNGIDLAGEGGMTWIKIRSAAGANHCIYDTARGVSSSNTNLLFANTSAANMTSSGGGTNKELYSFNNNGFTLGSDNSGNTNWDDKTAASWSFRKAKGFFDVVTWTGNGSNRTIAHSLGSVPGCIMVKRTDDSYDWRVFHVGLADSNNAAHYFLELNNTDAKGDVSNRWQDTLPTSTHISIGTNSGVNANGATYVAYLFAGGKSTAATARSVDFDGSGDFCSLASSSDLSAGSNSDTFTMEFWLKPEGWNLNDTIVLQNAGYWIHKEGSHFKYTLYNVSGTDYDVVSSTTLPEIGQWTHVAVVKLAESGGSNPTKMFINGTEVANLASGATNYTYPTAAVLLGGDGTNDFSGKISNFRFVKGTALYTSSFKPPTEPLTNITNTKLLCFNNSSVTGSTVAPGTITVTGDGVAASTDSPFDDPAGFVFGENGDQGIIKTGSYVGDGNGSSTQGIANSQEVYLGWEPQWILIKRASTAESWILYDSMRGISSVSADSQDAKFEVNNTDAEASINHINLTSTGFTFTTGNQQVNASNDSYVFVAIRRSDGYVGKPVEDATKVFAMAYGNSGGTNPSYVSNFPVDFALTRQPATGEAWYAAARLIQGRYLYTNTTNSEGDASSNFLFDHNNGWRDGSAATTYLSWMWKRNAGFDVVAYIGNGTAGHRIPHSLSKTPEMIFIKNRDTTISWVVGHKDLDGGNNPWTHYLSLNNSNAENDDTLFNDEAPTSTHFSVDHSNASNKDGSPIIAFLFASVDGISKVGSYSGSSSDVTITTGFTPRFVLVKRVNAGAHWHLFDSLRDLDASGTEGKLLLNENYAQSTTTDYINTTATGFIMESGVDGDTNGSGGEYIYYAHA